MTSFAFILGVLPLARATGPGAEMRVALGIAVFSGMLGVTFFGLFLTPVFYVVIRWFAKTNGVGPSRAVAVAAAADGVAETEAAPAPNGEGGIIDKKKEHLH